MRKIFQSMCEFWNQNRGKNSKENQAVGQMSINSGQAYNGVTMALHK